MNIKSYKYKLYASLTESNLKSELDLIKAISDYQRDGSIMGISDADIHELVNHILESRPDRNQMQAEEIKRRFNVQGYNECRLILDVVYYLVGRKWSEDKSKHTIKELAFSEENMWHGFYLGFSMSHEELAALANQIDASDELFLLRCRSMTVDRDLFVDFCRQDLGDNHTNDEIISKISHYNDGSYIELPPGVATLSSIILKEDAHDIWTELLCNLRYFPLQGSIIYSLDTIEQCMTVWEILAKKGYGRFKVVAYLLREQMLKLMVKETEMLERNAQSDQLDKADVEYGQNLLKEWNLKSADNTQRLVKLWVEALGVQETAMWFSNETGRLAGRPAKFVEYDTMVMAAIEKCIKPCVEINSQSIDAADYQTLAFYMKVASERGEKSEVYQELVCRFCKLTYNSRYIPQLKLEEQTFDLLRIIYTCILQSRIDGMSMVMSERYQMEGYQVDWDKAFSSCSADSLWFSVLLLQTEMTGDIDCFWRIIDNLFRCASYERSTVTDYYFMPFYIAEIIVVQIIRDQKDKFESMLINRISNLHFALRVLTANEGVLSEGNKEALRLRCKYEWPLEKELTIKQMQEQTDYLERYLEKVIGEKL